MNHDYYNIYIYVIITYYSVMLYYDMTHEIIYGSTLVLACLLTEPGGGEGSDHAWGGNYFVLGGAVRGGRVYNDFPASFKEGSAQDAGRGRLIPKYPWENMRLKGKGEGGGFGHEASV